MQANGIEIEKVKKELKNNLSEFGRLLQDEGLLRHQLEKLTEEIEVNGKEFGVLQAKLRRLGDEFNE